MAWTTPKTDWTTGELVTAENMNAVGENLATLKHPSTAVATTTERISTGSLTFVDVDNDNLNLTVTTTGGDVLIQFSGTVDHDDSARSYIDFEVDGVRLGGAYGIREADGNRAALTVAHLIQNLSAGTHTFKLQWRTRTGILNVNPFSQFWVREI